MSEVPLYRVRDGIAECSQKEPAVVPVHQTATYPAKLLDVATIVAA